MKLILVILILFPFIAIGQQRYFELGIDAGPNFSIIRGNEIVEDVEYYYKPNFTAGIFSLYQLNKTFSIKSGVYYEKKGADVVRYFPPFEYTETASENFEYLTIPILARADFGSKFRFFINSGPFISILLNQYTHLDPTRHHPETTEKGTDLYKSTEFGITVGAGCSYPLNKVITLSIEYRDNLGLSDINDRPYEFPYELRTNTMNFLVGISYKVLKEKK